MNPIEIAVGFAPEDEIAPLPLYTARRVVLFGSTETFDVVPTSTLPPGVAIGFGLPASAPRCA